jgi:hypothetical protein
VLAGHDVANREVRADQDGTLREAREDASCLVERGGVDVESEKPAGRSGAIEDRFGVSSPTDRPVEEAASFAGIKLGEYFGQKNRLMPPPTFKPRGP